MGADEDLTRAGGRAPTRGGGGSDDVDLDGDAGGYYGGRADCSLVVLG